MSRVCVNSWVFSWVWRWTKTSSKTPTYIFTFPQALSARTARQLALP